MAKNKTVKEEAVQEEAVQEEATQDEQTNVLSIIGADTKIALSQMKPLQRIAFLRKVSEYIGADTISADTIINTPIEICGVLVHDATINKATAKDANKETGEIEPVYITAKRTVFKLSKGGVLGFVSMSIENYVNNFLIPAFGVGDWMDEDGNPLNVKILVKQVTAKGGRAYSIQIL